jgi:hypothetical protein
MREFHGYLLLTRAIIVLEPISMKIILVPILFLHMLSNLLFCILGKKLEFDGYLNQLTGFERQHVHIQKA